MKKKCVFVVLTLLFSVYLPLFAQGNNPTLDYLRDLYKGSRFSKSTKGVITDHKTGRFWYDTGAKVRPAGTSHWAGKIGKGWRIPTKTELRKLQTATKRQLKSVFINDVSIVYYEDDGGALYSDGGLFTKWPIIAIYGKKENSGSNNNSHQTEWVADTAPWYPPITPSGSITCYKCDGTKEMECPDCHGTAGIECRTCHGSGKVRCSKCNGRGYLVRKH